jgi:hypothetical protein
VFYINLPVGIVSLVMTKLFIFDPPYMKTDTTRIDYWGIGLLAVGIGALQLLLDKGQEEDWFASDLMTALAAVAVVSLLVFLIHEWTTAEPVVDLRVFRIRTYSTGVFLMTTLGFVLYGSLVLLPILLQTLLGYPSLQAGMAMAPRGIGSFIGMPMVGLLIGRLDARKMVATGLLIGGITLIWLGRLNLSAGYWDFFWPQFVQGFALSLLFVPLTTITMDPIPRERMGNATSLFNLMRNIGGSIGIAVTGTMLARQQQAHYVMLGTNVDPLQPSRAVDVRPPPQRLSGVGLGPGDRIEPGACRNGRPGAPPGLDRKLRGDLPVAWADVPAAHPARAADEAADGTRRAGGGTLRHVMHNAQCKLKFCREAPSVAGVAAGSCSVRLQADLDAIWRSVDARRRRPEA